MQSNKLKKLIAIFFVLFIFSSCTKDLIVPDPPAPPPPPPPPGENQISYKVEIQTIWDAKCNTCHGNGGTPPVLTASKSWQNLMAMPGMIDTVNPGSSILYLEVLPPSGGMVQMGQTTKANADSIYKWIRQGAKNN